MEWLTATVPRDKPPVVQRFEPSDHDPAEGVVIYSVADLGLPLAPVDLSLVFGDALTNYRAVLDYIAWQRCPRTTALVCMWIEPRMRPTAQQVGASGVPRWLPGRAATT
jgi:hypothetical protein